MQRLMLFASIAALVFMGGCDQPTSTTPAKPKTSKPATPPAWTQVCKDDAKKLCANVEPGQGRIPKCLNENRDKLSAACKEAVAKAFAK